MKRLLKHLSNRDTTNPLFTVAVFATLGLLIWYGSPYLVFAHTTPFEQHEKRLYLMALLFLGWVFKTQFFDRTPETTAKPVRPLRSNHPEYLKKRQMLEGRFLGALQFLQKTMINKHGKESTLNHIPWFLLVGTSGSGKTTLMANAGINFILAKPFKNQDIKHLQPSDACDWWVTRDAVVVDVPGTYLYAKPKVQTNHPNSAHSLFHGMLWDHFLSLIFKKSKKSHLKGALITLSVSDLLNKQHNLTDIKLKIAELQTQFGQHFHFYFVLTKCDLLPGFLDFFSDSGSDELTQAWGVTLPTPKDNETIAELFNARFNALIKRLNKQLIWRMHQERNSQTRPLIKDFPLHIERIKESLLEFMKKVSETTPHFSLRGVYLSSAIQHAPEESSAPLQAASQQMLQLMKAPSLPCRAHFVKQLLLQGLLTQQDHTTTQILSTRRSRKVVIGVIASIAALFALIFANDMRLSVQQTVAIQKSLAQYRSDAQLANQKGVSIAKALPLLNALQAATTGTHSLLLHSDKAQQTANAAYRMALQTIVLSNIKNNITQYLLTASNKPADTVYAALEAYLMLGDKTHLNPEFIVHTMRQISPDLFNSSNAQKVSGHINAAFNMGWQSIPLDDDLINTARKQLTNLTALDLSYVILKNSDLRYLMPSILNRLPEMYTADTFQKIMNIDSDNAALAATQGSWVLGSYAATFNGPDTSVLAQQLKNLYVTDYVRHWESILSTLTLPTPTTMTDVQKNLAQLTEPHTDYVQQLKIIKQNTDFTPLLAASSKLTALIAFVNSTKIQQDLIGLETTLQNIYASDTSNKLAWELMQQTVTHPQNNVFINLLAEINATGAPVKNWLAPQVNFSLQHITTQASAYLEQQWQETIIRPYQLTIARLYPFALQANSEISLQDFSYFMGNKGSVRQFYTTYLQPLVDSSNTTWNWKTVAGTSLPFSSSSLAQLQTALTLQHTLFANETNPFAFKFSLQPMHLGKNTKSIQLDIDGQLIQYQRSQAKKTETINWPGTQKHIASLHLQTKKNETFTKDFRGDWGWLKLLDSTTKKMITPNQVILSFDINGHTAQYLLTADNNLPTLNLNDLKLPEKL